MWRADAELVIKGNTTVRASLIMLGGLPLNPGQVGWLTEGHKRHEQLAIRVGLENKWAHCVDVSWIGGTAAGEADSSLSQWKRKYSTATKEISADWKVAELVREITNLKTEWHAFKGADGKPVRAPTLPEVWFEDTKITEPHWAEPLTNWTVSNINKTLKPLLCAMLAKSQAVLEQSSAIDVEARSQVDARVRLQIDADSLTRAIAAHPLIRPLPSAAALAERVRLCERKRGATDDTRGSSEQIGLPIDVRATACLFIKQVGVRTRATPI